MKTRSHLCHLAHPSRRIGKVRRRLTWTYFYLETWNPKRQVKRVPRCLNTCDTSLNVCLWPFARHNLCPLAYMKYLSLDAKQTTKNQSKLGKQNFLQSYLTNSIVLLSTIIDFRIILLVELKDRCYFLWMGQFVIKRSQGVGWYFKHSLELC